ncbi:hypothetical protein B0J11DRAFT_302877 [Dendryphion nanum]|uniref:Mitochondrial inner membrane protein COX18 n=1 Tax=Dendryphion nanum TaxID=256645 RepID=A0A9P9DU57_9PLEO|nr:hypothetical protein B0J11DRAFT_302877 [Dendryphion nanum]
MFASRLLRPPGRQLLSKSSITNPSPVFLPRTRAFHASTPRNAIEDVILYLPHELLQYLHIGLPWYAAIPVTAFIVRGLLVTTAGSYVRSNTARFHALMPLRRAMSLQAGDRVMRKGSFSDPRQANVAVNSEIKKETRALDKRWNCSLWGQVGWTVAQLPLFLVMAEVIRRMSGINTGLLGLGLNAVGLKSSSIVEKTEISDSGAYGADIDATPWFESYGTDIVANPWFDSSLADGGILWFTNLLVADPTHMLGFGVSALMFANIYLSKNGSVGTPNRLQRILRRSMLLVSLAIGPLCIDVPAGLLWYWASSTTSVIVWNVWLDRKYPIVKGFEPCRRQLLTPPPMKMRSR